MYELQASFYISNVKRQLRILSLTLVIAGNTCRSPIAEAVFIKLATERGVLTDWSIDSAALAPWHIGEPPNERSVDIIKTLHIEYEHVARQITSDDFRNFDFIFGMDEYNMERLRQIAPSDSKAQLLLLGSFDPKGERIIRDPYCVSCSSIANLIYLLRFKYPRMYGYGRTVYLNYCGWMVSKNLPLLCF